MKRTSRILTLILALVMIMSALVCISVFAEEEEVKPSIGAANVVYGEEIRIAFTIKDAGEGEYGRGLGCMSPGSRGGADPVGERRIDRIGIHPVGGYPFSG